KMRLSGGDIKTAYLHGRLKETIFMRQPPMFYKYDENGQPLICKLKRSIYGLKQSGACWEARFAEELRILGFTNCEADPCLWKRKDQAGFVLLAVYVDDLLFVTSSTTAYDKIVYELKERFEVTGTGDLEWLLGTRIDQSIDLGTIRIDQSLYIQDMMREYNIDPQGRLRTTPAQTEILNLTPLEEHEKINPLYQSAVGKLLWVALRTRPDIAFATIYLARFASAGGDKHMYHVYNIMKYLAKTADYQMTFGESNHGLWDLLEKYSPIGEINEMPDLLVMADASFGGEKPPAGLIIFYMGMCVTYAAFRTAITPLSSAEAEYLAITRAVQALIPIIGILKFIGTSCEHASVPVMTDNKAAIQLADSDTSSRRMRHVVTRMAYLKEQIESGVITLYHIYSKGMVADIFTKPLLADLFHSFRKILVGD
ncbi:MAG: reverse transcriptase domain-containing protein, partial [Candidatus Nanopelagicaceae bacterium]